MADTCLGCGCTCDDIGVEVEGGRIIAARNACPLGISWFGDGDVPSRVLLGGREAAVDEALDAIVRLLSGARQPLVYIAPDLTCEAQREAVAIADCLQASLDSVTSSTALGSILAGQELGRAGATLGEIRNRADVVVFWGVDPSVRYPRYWTRYAPEPAGVHLAGGRSSRTVVAVDVGRSSGPADADLRVAIPVEREVAALTQLKALTLDEAAQVDDGEGIYRRLLSVLLAGRYVALVADAEPDETEHQRDGGRAAGLVSLVQALNARTRAALNTLRAGGNRPGADACLTSQTGYPAAVDFMRGYPRYRPYDGTAAMRLARGEVDAMLIVGSAAAVPHDVTRAAAGVRRAIVGPRASGAGAGAFEVAIDTGVAGVHESGIALRMDDVPVPVAAPLAGPPAAAAVLRALRGRILESVPVARSAG